MGCITSVSMETKSVVAIELFMFKHHIAPLHAIEQSTAPTGFF